MFKIKEDTSFERLKKIILGEEEEKISQLIHDLQELRHKMSDEEALIESLDPVITSLLQRKIIESKDEMAEALGPVMGEAIRHQISEAKDDMVDSLYPIIGKTIRKSVAEAMKNLVDTVNRRIDKALRGGLLFKRIKSIVTGVSEAELIVKEALPFQVQEVLLISRTSGLLIAHTAQIQSGMTVDKDLISGMLTAIQDFVTEAFKSQSEQDLERIQYGDSKILLELGRTSYLAVVVTGIEPDHFRSNVQALNRRIHNRFYKLLRNYDGDSSQLSELTVLLQKFLKQYSIKEDFGATEKPMNLLPRLLISLLVLFLVLFSAIRLPGYLKDRKIRHRVENILNTTPGVKAQFTVSRKRIEISGNASSMELPAHIDSMLKAIPAVKGITNRLRYINSRDSILHQIDRKISSFPHLRDVRLHLGVDRDEVIVEGEVRSMAIKREIGYLISNTPGVRVTINNLSIVQEKIDPPLTVAAFLKARMIYFIANSYIFTEDQYKKLDEIADFMKSNVNAKWIIKGHSDNHTDEFNTFELSKRRIQAVFDYLIFKGVPENKIETQPLGDTMPLATAATDSSRAVNRRVEFEFKKEVHF